MKNWRAIVALLLTAVGGSYTASAQGLEPGPTPVLRSPWDAATNSSALKAMSVQKAGGQSQCKPAPRLSANLSTSGFYADKSHSVRDEARWKKYRKETRSYRDAADAIIKLADDARLKNDTAAAQCAASWLKQLADDDALGGKLTGAQAHYTQAWMLNAYATAWLKIRDLIPDDDAAHRVVPSWISQLADDVIAFTEENKIRNNLRYWAGLAVMNAGIVADKKDKFDGGVNSFYMGADSIKKNGSLPREMRRASMARNYHMYAAAPLIMMAELGHANGVDLYSRNNNAIHRLVKFILDGVDDPAKFNRAAGAEQKPVSKNFTWLRAYAKRFPDPRYDKIFAEYPAVSYRDLGGRM